MPLSKFLQKLLFVKKFNIKDGKIELLGDRYVMLNASSVSSLQDIDKEKFYKKSKKSSKKDLSKMVKHAQVYENIKSQELKNVANLSKKIGKNEKGIVKTLETIFEIYGLGELNIVDMDNDENEAKIRIKDSTIAEMQEEESDKPVCSITAGTLAGIFSYIFDEDVDCVEKKCKGKGDQVCEFEISSSE